MSKNYIDILNNYVEMNNFITTIAKQQDEYILGELNAKVNVVMGVNIEPERLEKWVRQSMFIEKFTVEQLRDFAIDRLARRLLKEKDQKIQELEHRLSNCIEPKFKVGQEVWFIDWDRQIRIGKVEDISYFCSRDSIEYEIGYSNGYDEDESDWFGEKIIYTTEEEAKAKLEKMKNG